MKEKELRKHAVCSLCKKKIGTSMIPAFWVVKIQHHGIKADAVQRQSGLEMMLGGQVALAQVMGADEDMTMPLMEELTLSVCETCSINPDPLPVAVMAEFEGLENG